MMDAMLKAIKEKRGGQKGLMEDMGKAAGAMAEEKMDLNAIVDSLSEDDKMLLMEKLGAGQKAEDKSQKLPVERGGMSEGERLAVDKKILEEDEDEIDEDENDVDSDEIALGMVGNRFKGEDDGQRPTNLSQRVQMEMAKKLKAKGKI